MRAHTQQYATKRSDTHDNTLLKLLTKTKHPETYTNTCTQTAQTQTHDCSHPSLSLADLIQSMEEEGSVILTNLPVMLWLRNNSDSFSKPSPSAQTSEDNYRWEISLSHTSNTLITIILLQLNHCNLVCVESNSQRLSLRVWNFVVPLEKVLHPWKVSRTDKCICQSHFSISHLLFFHFPHSCLYSIPLLQLFTPLTTGLLNEQHTTVFSVPHKND